MSPPLAPPVAYTPVFNWLPPRSRRTALTSFIAGSIALHALCFYLFRIIYPPTVSLLPPPARVNIITGDSEAGRVLLRWIEAEDPALASTTQRPTDAAVRQPPAARYVTSLANYQPQLRDLPPPERHLEVPSAYPPGPVPSPRPSAGAGTSASVATTLHLDQTESLGAPVLPPLSFHASAGDVPEAARFRLGVDPAGAVRHCFLVDASGDPALDEQARQLLLRVRFPGAKIDSNTLRWTTATLEWGNDLAPAPEQAAP